MPWRAYEISLFLPVSLNISPPRQESYRARGVIADGQAGTGQRDGHVGRAVRRQLRLEEAHEPLGGLPVRIDRRSVDLGDDRGSSRGVGALLAASGRKSATRIVWLKIAETSTDSSRGSTCPCWSAAAPVGSAMSLLLRSRSAPAARRSASSSAGSGSARSCWGDSSGVSLGVGWLDGRFCVADWVTWRMTSGPNAASGRERSRKSRHHRRGRLRRRPRGMDRDRIVRMSHRSARRRTASARSGRRWRGRGRPMSRRRRGRPRRRRPRWRGNRRQRGPGPRRIVRRLRGPDGRARSAARERQEADDDRGTESSQPRGLLGGDLAPVQPGSFDRARDDQGCERDGCDRGTDARC